MRKQCVPGTSCFTQAYMYVHVADEVWYWLVSNPDLESGHGTEYWSKHVCAAVQYLEAQKLSLYTQACS